MRVVGDRCLVLVFRLSFAMEVKNLAQVWCLLLCGDCVLILVLTLVLVISIFVLVFGVDFFIGVLMN